MLDLEFKYIHFGNKFEYEGIEYTKTNFMRGYYYKESRKVFKRFKKTHIVKSEIDFWDVRKGQ